MISIVFPLSISHKVCLILIQNVDSVHFSQIVNNRDSVGDFAQAIHRYFKNLILMLRIDHNHITM